VYIYSVTVARILASGSLDIYSPTLQHDTASAYLHTQLPPSDITDFDHPPLEALLLIPISHLSIHVSYLIFTSVSLALVAAAVWLIFCHVLPQQWDGTTKTIVIATSVCTLPAAAGLWGDWSALLLLPAVGAVILSRQHRLAAGLCLGVLLLRPQLVWLLPVLLICLRQWRILAGMALGALFWVVSTFAILGPGHIMDFPRAIQQADVSGGNGYSLGIPGALSSVFFSTFVGYVTLGLFIVATAAIAWRFRHALTANIPVTVAAGLCLSMAAAPHIEPWDFILLAVPICVWARTNAYRAVLMSVVVNALQILTFNDVSGPAQHLLFVAPVAVAAGLILDAARKPRAPALQTASA